MTCKPLWGKLELNKKNLETAARWYKEVDIYIEKSVSEEDKETSLHEEEKENHEEAEGGNVKFTPKKTSARILICPRREHPYDKHTFLRPPQPM